MLASRQTQPVGRDGALRSGREHVCTGEDFRVFDEGRIYAQTFDEQAIRDLMTKSDKLVSGLVAD